MVDISGGKLSFHLIKPRRTIFMPERGLFHRNCIKNWCWYFTHECNKGEVHHFQIILICLTLYGLVINHDQCLFGISTLDFLGHCTNSADITLLEDCVQAICNFHAPTSKTSLQEYLGLINFSYHFYPHYAEVLHPLYQPLKG